MTRITYPRKLTRRQAEIVKATERFLVLVAGRRFGKTVLAVAWLVLAVLTASAGALAYYVLPFRHQAKAVAWEELKRATRGFRVSANETELSVTLPGDRRIVLKGADDPESLEGVGLVAVVLDEFARMKLAAWEKSLRPALSDHSGRALIIGKPRGHNHLRDFFLHGQSATKRDGWRSWQYRTVDGGFVPESDIAEARRDLPPRIFRQEYEASFETLAGRIYEEFSPSVHVLAEPVDPRAFGAGCIGIDWGWTHPFAAEALGQGGGREVVVAEVVRAEFRLDDVASALASLRDQCPGWRWVADPSRPDLIREFSGRLGVEIEPAVNDVDDGILELSKALHVREGLGPSLFVSPSCPELVRSLDSYVWDTDREGKPRNKPAKINDDAADALRYAKMGLVRRAHVGSYEGGVE